jgi:hypothetical protein
VRMGSINGSALCKMTSFGISISVKSLCKKARDLACAEVENTLCSEVERCSCEGEVQDHVQTHSDRPISQC